MSEMSRQQHCSHRYHGCLSNHLRGGKALSFLALVVWACSVQVTFAQGASAGDESKWEKCLSNGVSVQEGLNRCRLFVDGWLQYADPRTGLIPRNLESDIDIWNAKDAAADNYPFMVLTAAFTDQTLFEGRMLSMLRNEELLTSRVGQMPDTYQFSVGRFQKTEVDLDQIIFGASEYIKDGLLPLTEWLGESPWSKRMINILDDIWQHAPIETAFGKIPSNNVEVNGEMLQVLSRIYWMLNDEKYLHWALRLGDYYLLGSHHPSRDMTSLRLRDHGCEIISGLCELYATTHFADPEKKAVYREPLLELLNRTLEVGRNEDGLFYDLVNPQTGEVIKDRIADNFGYNLNGFYTLYQIDSFGEFRDATSKALSVLATNYRNFDWENGSADGYADAIEGALNLFNREPISSTADWIDSEIRVMWDKQQENGIIEGWHGDGNFARTTIMYTLWKSKGVHVKSWRKDLKVGAEMNGDTIWITLGASSPWKGTLVFDVARHQEIFHLPFDWPRINQFPEWYTVEADQEYHGFQLGEAETLQYQGSELAEGISVNIDQSDVKLKLWRK